MQFSATQIAALLQGTIEGNADASVTKFGKIEEAQTGEITFLANPKYTEYLYTTQASIAIVNADLQTNGPITPTLIRVPNAYAAFAQLLQFYTAEINKANTKSGVEEPSFIHATASIGNNVYIGAFVYIGANAIVGDGTKLYPHTFVGDGAKIGKNTTLFAGVKIYHACEVGDNCILHAGCILGSDGFGFAKQDGVYAKIPQIGNVVVENNVEIGANCCIDRATMGSTVLRNGVKLDNMVQIAHNVELGENTVAAGLSAVAGSTKVGKEVIIGAQAGVAGHLKIANHAMINGQAGVSKSISVEGMAVTGSPASEFKSMMRSQAALRNLPEMLNRINQLEKELIALKNNRPS
jgi:UDP-3-O-[3-hydroxymyristoyl] glucosamine N-acyltransferase